jgi:hypothetical protein
MESTVAVNELVDRKVEADPVSPRTVWSAFTAAVSLVWSPGTLMVKVILIDAAWKTIVTYWTSTPAWLATFCLISFWMAIVRSATLP